MLDFANLGILLGFSPTGVRQIRFFCLSDTPFGNIARGSSPSKARRGTGFDIAVRTTPNPQKILLCLSETDSPSLFGSFKHSVWQFTQYMNIMLIIAANPENLQLRLKHYFFI